METYQEVEKYISDNFTKDLSINGRTIHFKHDEKFNMDDGTEAFRTFTLVHFEDNTVKLVIHACSDDFKNYFDGYETRVFENHIVFGKECDSIIDGIKAHVEG